MLLFKCFFFLIWQRNTLLGSFIYNKEKSIFAAVHLCISLHISRMSYVQSNLNGSNIFGAMEIRSRHG